MAAAEFRHASSRRGSAAAIRKGLVTSPQAGASGPARRPYIDWLRGVAVLIMVEAHVIDAWIRPLDRTSPIYGYLILVGGFAAPLFLWLAGVGLALSAERALVRTGSRSLAAQAVVSRGLEIFILAFLFRLQAFLVSPGSWLVTIFRVDILNVMGVALTCAGAVWGLAGTPRRAAVAMAGIAAAVALGTPLIRTAEWVGALPLWPQWYLRPFSDHTTFTLFPWAGFVFAGAVVGIVLAHAPESGAAERGVQAALAAGGLLVAIGCLLASYRPAIYPVTGFWTSSPTYFGIRTGMMTLALAATRAALPLRHRMEAGSEVLSKLGRNSLFVYWIHVEIVYGYLSWGIHRRLSLPVTLIAYTAFVVTLYLLIGLKDRLVLAGRLQLEKRRTAAAVAA